MQSKPLTNLQRELLKIFSFELPEEELIEVKKILSSYFADKASDEMDKFWDEKNLSNEDMDRWLNEDLRPS